MGNESEKKHVERQDNIRRTEVQGNIERDLIRARGEADARYQEQKANTIRAEGEVRIGKIRAEGEIAVKKEALNNERKRDDAHHKEEMKKIENEKELKWKNWQST